MAQVPIPLKTLSNSSSSSSSSPPPPLPPPQSVRRSPMICPLAKLGRSSPTTMENLRNYRSPSADIGYRRSPLDPSVYSYLRGIPSPLEPSIYVNQSPLRESHCYRTASSPRSNEENENYKNRKNQRNVINNTNISETSFQNYHADNNDNYYGNKNSSNNYHPLMKGSSSSSGPESRNGESSSQSLPQSSYRPPSVVVDPANVYHQRMMMRTTKTSNNDKVLSRDARVVGSHNNVDPSYYLQLLANQKKHDIMRSSPLRRISSPTIDHSSLLYQQTTDLDASYKMGRTSPSLDQGYHTLVSPSPGPSTPGPWADYNNPLSVVSMTATATTPTVTTTSSSGKGKKLSGKCFSYPSNFDRLPDESVIKIFSWLDSSDLCICARVCKRWKSLVWEPQLWRIIKLSGENVSGDNAVRSVLRRLCGQNTTGACPTVEKVLLSDGARITDKGLMQLSRRCTELTHLQLHGCSAVTNNAIFELVTKCTNLQHLDLTGKSLSFFFFLLLLLFPFVLSFSYSFIPLF